MKYPFVGDLSPEDVQVLLRCAEGASRILEFGVGGSTQILAQALPPETEITSIDTSPEWMERTRTLLRELGVSERVQFHDYSEYECVGQYDCIFDDGLATVRAGFAVQAWPYLAPGGRLVVHDTRRDKDIKWLSVFIALHWRDLEEVQVNPDNSNSTVLVKRAERAEQVHWNAGREGWKITGEGRPADWIVRLTGDTDVHEG